MLVLKLAEETLSADEAVVEDSPRGAQEFRDQRIAQELTRADPVLAPGHDIVGAQDRELLRHDPSLHTKCVLEFLHVLVSFNQQSSIRIRIGCASVLKNAALNA